MNTFNVGDLYLINQPYQGILKEEEIIDVCHKPALVRTPDGWEKAEDFNKKVLCKLGHYDLRGWGIFKRRVFVKER